MTRLLTKCSIAFIATLVISIFLPISFLTTTAISLIAVVVLLIILSFFVKKLRNLSIILVFCMVSVLNVCLYNYNIIKPAKALIGTDAEITAVITSTEVSHSGNQYYIASLLSVNDKSAPNSTQICIYPSNHEKLNDYDKVKVTVNFFDFDNSSADNYYRSNNVNAYAKATSDILVINKNDFSLLREICKIRDKMTFNIRANMNDETGNIVCSILFGKRDYISKDTSQIFATAGISHVMAVSGLHLSIIIMMINSLLELFGVNKKLRFVLCIFASALLLIMTGFTPSTIRAVIMLIFSLSAQNIRRDYDSFTALCISAVLICLFNPYSITNVGFLLSFSATFGLIVSQSVIKNIRKKFSLKSVSVVKLVLFEMSSRIIPCFFAFIFTIPVSACVFGYISPYSVLTNFFLSTIFAIVLGISLITAILSLFPISIGILIDTLEFLISLISWVAETVSLLPYARVFIKSDITLPLVIAVVIIFAIACISKNSKINIAYASVCSIFLISLSVMLNTIYYAGTTKISVIEGDSDCVLIETPYDKIISGYNTDADYELGEFATNSSKSNILVMTVPNISSKSVSSLTHFVLNNNISYLSVDSNIAAAFSSIKKHNNKCYISNDFKITKDKTEVKTQTFEKNSVTFVEVDGFKIAHLNINSTKNIPDDFSCDLLIANSRSLLVLEHYKHKYFMLSDKSSDNQYLTKSFAKHNVVYIGDGSNELMIKDKKLYTKNKFNLT